MAPTDWHILPSSKPAKPLLVQTDFGSSAYTVRVTNVNSVWSETLDRERLIQRAREVESDIHPEEDQSQMRILLEKVEGALHQRDNSQVFVRTISGRIELFLTIPLPGGLNDLQWTMKLDRQPASALQAHVINSTLALAFLQKQQIDELTRKLEDKDVAISKLLDKVESMGLDFGTLFPTARLNRRLDQRKQVFQQVPGLAVFDKENWRANAATVNLEQAEPIAVLEEAFKYSSSGAVYALAQRLPVAAEGRPSTPARTRDLAAEDSRINETKDESQSQLSGFQRQATPEQHRKVHLAAHRRAHGKKHSPKALSPAPQAPEATEEESTDDEEDLDSGFQRQASPHQWRTPTQEPPKVPVDGPDPPNRRSPSPAKRRKLGGLKSKSTPAREQSMSASSELFAGADNDQPQQAESRTLSPPARPPSPTAAKHAQDKPQVSSDTSSRTNATSEEPAPPPKQQKPAKKLGKLGKIGGKRASNDSADTAPRDTTAQPQPEREHCPMNDAPEAPPTPKKKLGKIGARHTADKASGSSGSTAGALPAGDAGSEDVALSVEAGHETPAPTSHQPPRPPSPEVEETPEEKANRKRQALKQDLNAAKPAGKKKRRF